MSNAKKSTKVIALIMLLAVLCVFALVFIYVGRPLIEFLDKPEEFREWINGFGIWSRLIFIGIVFLQVTVAVIPGEPFEIAAGYTFGSIEGTLLCIIGMTISGVLIFALVRKYGVKFVELFFSTEKINSLKFLNDSKKLSDKRRRELFPVIKERAIAYGIAFADHKEIDEINILQATYLAMERAISKLSVKPDLALIDGNRAKDFGIPVETVIHGDSLSASIAAASILAKVTRDDYMLQMAEQYRGYGFEIHKGYGTKAHYAALTEQGPCQIHRMTFLKKFYGEK